MNKKLIALALSALPAIAMADVTIYGTIAGDFSNSKTYGSSGLTPAENRPYVIRNG